MARVTLTSAEMLLAGQVGLMRQVQNLKLKKKDRFGFEGDPWGVHVNAAMAEFAVAKLLGVFWSGNLGNYEANDAGEVEVRYTKYSDGRLILHDSDKDDARYYLVRGAFPTVSVPGWILGRDGKDKKFWHDVGNGRPAYFVGSSHLNRVE